MKRIVTYVVIALIAFAVGAFASSKWFTPEPRVITKTETVVQVVTKINSVPYAVIDTVRVKSKPVVITIPSSPTSVREVETTKYTGQEVLNNGTIDYTIYADSLRATAFKLTTRDSIVTHTIENTVILPPISRLYLSGGVNSSTSGFNVNSASAGLMYNRRQKWGVGISVTKDLSGLLPSNQQTSIGARVYIGL